MQCFTMESGEVHDRVTGAVQNATHAALLTFGTARPARPSMTRSLL
jgi:prephenate dehydrogenase